MIILKCNASVHSSIYNFSSDRNAPGNTAMFLGLCRSVWNENIDPAANGSASWL